ncbi:MAG: T9SS type A sorting domain-containing protein, partial [Flavobacteriales bacterium]|nr:T9SS type A sorting domain-containing protein [Flavobacteriales bacterium]
SLACNYDSIAQCDDGSCLTIYGCTDSLACNYNSTAQCDDGSCLTVYGCMNSLACNYDSTAQCDDGSCLTLFGCTDPLAYNFDSLTTCNDSSCIYEYNVTFQLDLREQTSISYTTPEINGTFNGWCGNCAQMTDVNNDSIWEITVAILEGTGPVSGVPGWEYKFSADNWNIQENLFSGDPCTFTSSGYTNRFINITKDTILDPVCWGSCNDCYVPQTSYNVTFQVDMANVSGFSVPEINGVFNEWCGSCWPMTDIDGDNIWEFTALIDTSIQEYKFSADNWTIQEDLDSNLSCILINYDSASPNGWGYVNRYLNINSDTLLEILCWNECDTCLSTTGFISNVNNHSYTIYPNPSTSIFYVKSSDKIDKIIVYDILNKKIFEKNDPAILQSFDISDINSNILFLEIYINDKVRRDKLIITK